MPKVKRERAERTDDWEQLRLLAKWPEQVAYELIRPVVIYGETAGERARATGENERTIDRKADRFDQEGMLGMFTAQKRQPVEDARSLSPPMRQLIVNLRAEMPTMSLHEIADICFVQYERRPSHHTIQRVLATGPAPSITKRRYLPYAQIPDPAQRGLRLFTCTPTDGESIP